MMTINGQNWYVFDDLVARNGDAIAEEVFDSIEGTTDFWIEPLTGEIGFMPPVPIDESCAFDEVGWADLCSRADKALIRSWDKGRVRDDVWNF